MKRLWLILFLLLIVGCSKEPEKPRTIVDIGGVYYILGTDGIYKQPYSGVMTKDIGRGLIEETTVKDGKKDGLFTRRFEDGQKEEEGTYKDGDRDGLWTVWYKNGQKIEEGTYKDGDRDGLYTYWYVNGPKQSEYIYMDGNLLTQECWDEDGNECLCFDNDIFDIYTDIRWCQ